MPLAKWAVNFTNNFILLTLFSRILLVTGNTAAVIDSSGTY